MSSLIERRGHLFRLKYCNPCARYPYKIAYGTHRGQVEAEKKLAAYSDNMELKSKEGAER